MNQWLNSMYNTVGDQEEVKEASAEEAAAELEVFAKVAADHGINLEELSADEVADLYNETMKVASEESDDKEDDKEEDDKEEDGEKEAAALEEAAAFEHEQQKEAAAKLAEAELMGQVMAHSFASELDSIQQAKIAKELPPALKEKAEEMKEKAKEKDEDEEKDASAIVQHGGKKGMSKLKKALIAGAAGAAAAAGGGAYAHKKSKEGKKEASAFDTLAAQHAVKIAEAADYDVDECVERLNAVFTLGQVEESTKVAHIADQGDATHVRSLELLETAGYPVDWEEVFGA